MANNLREALCAAIGDSARVDAAIFVIRKWLESEETLVVASDAIDEHDAWEISVKERGYIVGIDLLPCAVLKALADNLDPEALSQHLEGTGE